MARQEAKCRAIDQEGGTGQGVKGRLGSRRQLKQHSRTVQGYFVAHLSKKAACPPSGCFNVNPQRKELRTLEKGRKELRALKFLDKWIPQVLKD